jgi:hypothetical protein
MNAAVQLPAHHHSVPKKSPQADCLLESPLLVPVVLLIASYVVYIYPERGVAVLLFLGALGTFTPTNGSLVCLVAELIERVSIQAMRSEKLLALAKEANHAVVSDPYTKAAFAEACRSSLQDTMLDERTQDAMIACCSKAVTTATIAASQDEDLLATLNIVMRNGVKEALNDEGLINTFFTVLRDGLRDPKIHQAALKGAVTAANPLKDVKVPSLPQTNPLKDVPSKLKEVMVDAEAAMLSHTSGLSRVTPPARSSVSSSSSGNQASPPVAHASPIQLLGGPFGSISER